ncbi:MAG: hypothetical protein ACM3ME_04610 [Chloroflexota bacterium]
MKNVRTGIIIVIIGTVIFFIGSAIRSYYLFLKEPVAPVTDALPSNTSLIISTKSVFRLFESVNNSALVDLLNKKDSYFPEINNCIDSIELKYKSTHDLIKSTEVVFALTDDSRQSFLIGISVGKTGINNINDKINEIIESKGLAVVRETNGFYSISANSGKVWYYIRKGILVMSPDSSLLNSSLQTLISGKNLNTDAGFKRLRQSTGKSSDACVMLNNQALARSIWPEKAALLRNGTPFDGWTSFDVTIKKGEVALGGFTFSNSQHLLKGQQPIYNTSYLLYPPGTSFALTLTLSDQQSFIANYFNSDTLHVNGYDASIKQPTTEIFRPKRHLNAWIGNSVSLIVTKGFFRGGAAERLVIIESKDKDSAMAYLKPYIEPINDSLGRFCYSTICEDLWGPVFSLPGELYCLISNKSVVFSASRRLIDQFNSNQGARDKDLRKIREIASEKSNVFIYLEPQSIGEWMRKKNQAGNASLVRFLAGNTSIGFEYSVDKELQYTHAWLALNPKRNNPSEDKELTADLNPPVRNDKAVSEEVREVSKEEKVVNEQSIQPAFKEIPLKSGSYKPQVITGKNKNEKRIAILTKKGTLSIYDHTGGLLWTFDCKESTFEKLLEADYNRNGRTNYLITTKNKLYILDTEGNEIKGSPVRLPETATGGFSLIDYENNRDYRLLYVGSDEKLYNITLKGKELPDWQKPKVSGTGYVSFVRSGGKDYLVYQYEDKVLRVFDRRGRERLKFNNKFTISPKAQIYPNKTNSKGVLLTVNASGEMVYISDQGTLSKSSFGRFGTSTWFTYTDFNADGVMDFIFAKNNRIVAYTKMKSVIADRVLKKGTFGTPVVYSSSTKDRWIFARNIETDEVTGFNNKGKSYPVSIKSESDPIIFNPGGSLKEIMLTSKNGKLIITELGDL